MPPWVKRIFDEFPIPTTRSAEDGSFRLVGVMPGSNMFAVTAREHLSFVRDSVMVRAGQEKNVGRVGMRFGEELYAKVLDTKGEPVAGAEVAAGSTISMVPVDLAQLLGETNADGEIDGTGFAPGKVTVAARQSRSTPGWSPSRSPSTATSSSRPRDVLRRSERPARGRRRGQRRALPPPPRPQGRRRRRDVHDGARACGDAGRSREAHRRRALGDHRPARGDLYVAGRR